jgi:serine/threonine-protein kinase
VTASSTPEFLALQTAVAGTFSIERELGRGGMGIVFLARDVALDRPVAIKLLPPAFVERPELRERFLREARTAAGLSHPNVVSIHSVQEQSDLVFFVMGYVDGESLAQRVRRQGPLSSSDVGRLVQEVAWALAYAHGRGVIHRDVKPDNILLEKGSGRAMVTDFGIARVANQAPGLTGHHEILGTAQYMSPEQASGETTDARSDLYSLGATAYFALTGKAPFEGASLAAVLARVLTEPAAKVSAERPDVPPLLAGAIDRCLAKDRADRFATGEELADAIGAAQLAPREVPPQVRRLLNEARQVGAISGIGLQLLLASWVVALVRPPPGLGDPFFFFPFAIGLVWVATVLVALFGIARRLVLKAGLGFADVQAAVEDAARARAEENRAAIHATDPNWRWRFLALSLRGGLWLIALALASLNVALFLWPSRLTAILGPSSLIAIFVGVLFVLNAVLLGPLSVLIGRFIDPLRRRFALRRRPLELGLEVLDGRLGRILFRLAGLGLHVERQTAPAAMEPTEVLLGNAVEGLFQALPTEVRRRLADIPETVARLAKDAEILRERDRALGLALLQAAADRRPIASERREAAVAELTEARDSARRRLAAAVGALENIRLDLLRLQAGVGSVDDLTDDLARAREINEAVGAELEARQEVRRILARTPA